MHRRAIASWLRTTLVAGILLVTSGSASVLRAQHLLLPMDDAQRNHLKAYGVTYQAIKAGQKAEWFLNYRGGAFLIPDVPDLRRRAALDGVTVEPLTDAGVAAARAEIAGGNMDAVVLERAPRIAIYRPVDQPPWDDAVTLALTYAGIDFTSVWDDEVMRGDLSKFDWVHLHHEDFTGQYNKLYLAYRDAPWFVAQRERDMATARRFDRHDVPGLKKAVADNIRLFVERGGFLFAMCGATESLDLSIASFAVDIAGPFSDGTPPAPDADARMDWTRALAFRGAHVEPSPYVNALSDIDGHQVNVPSRRQPLGAFALFGFSAKLDPVATMLVQDHRTVVPDFYGVTTSFNRAVIKPGVTILAQEDGAPWAKYLHGDYGKGSWTFLGGHDPEDPQHAIGSAPTDLSLHPNSPGYRLILNNVLFPAAKKKPRKT
ncbi:MAG: asparagine synthetase B [Gemmatimonadetes bacterium]|nr:asparagine synthetase B [Gemmatimonadota bacterium]